MKWYLETGPEGDVVISTRVRLARNIAEVPFPCKMTPQQCEQVEQKARDALLESNSAIAGEFEFLSMQKLTPARAMSLAEKHLISPEFAQEREGRALLLKKDESVSIMLNEEDHVRIQALYAGFQLDEALETASRIDDLFDERLRFAFDENLGYLTQCPTNLGTGLRASLMLHLPAITWAGSIPGLSQAVAKLGFTIRGRFGEGTKANGSFYQISNQITLGITEREAVENLRGIAKQIIAQEREARSTLQSLGPQVEDKIFRSYGLLREARLLSNDEFMALISDLRLGIAMGIVKGVSLEGVNELLSSVQPATLIAGAGRKLEPQGRDFLRASIVREKLGA